MRISDWSSDVCASDLPARLAARKPLSMSRSIPAITVSRLGWSTPDGRAVLSNLDLRFAPERTGIVGRNGVGKSTLLRLLTGDLAPSTGSVAIEGRIAMLRQTVQVAPDETIDRKSTRLNSSH